jgi:hypothetical protein
MQKPKILTRAKEMRATVQAGIARLFQSRAGRNVSMVFLVLTLGGAGYGLKKSYVPGPVSAAHPRGQMLGGFESHAEFEKECLHCHAPVRCLSANLCQDCHMDIARERAEATGLHGLLPGTNRCQNCHVEHQGRDALISNVSFVNINHERLTNFGLEHHETDYDGTPLTCNRCHVGGRFSAESVDCTHCHSSDDPNYMGEHTERFGGNCLGCHDGRDRMTDLDHNLVFVLEGAHETVECEECHADQTFADVARGCVVCHQDPAVHAGQFGLDCVRCHTAFAWTPAQLTQHTFLLDHGDEGEVACETCHVGTYAQYTCYQCHDHDRGEMQTVHLEQGIAKFDECIECHPTGRAGEAQVIAGERTGPSEAGGSSGQ